MSQALLPLQVLGKDANINVQAVAAKCLHGVASGLRKKFAPFAVTVVPTVFEKFKEKKPLLRDPLVECIDAVAASVSFTVSIDFVFFAILLCIIYVALSLYC